MKSFNKGDVSVSYNPDAECWEVVCSETDFLLGQFDSEEEAHAFIKAKSED